MKRTERGAPTSPGIVDSVATVITIGLTGGIGSGKSTASALLAARGAEVVDADVIARQVVEPGAAAYGGVVDRFGERILLPDGTVDRPALAAIVFKDQGALADLNALTWPAVGAAIEGRLEALQERDVVVILDIPLLVESGRREMAGLIVVDVPVEVAVSRLVEQRGMDEGDVRRRIANQAPREERLARADFVIDNSGDRAHLEHEVERAWKWIETLRADAGPRRYDR